MTKSHIINAVINEQNLLNEDADNRFLDEETDDSLREKERKRNRTMGFENEYHYSSTEILEDIDILEDIYIKLLDFKNEKIMGNLHLTDEEVEIINSTPEVFVKSKPLIYRGTSFKEKPKNEIIYKSKYKFSSWTFDKKIAELMQYSYCKEGNFCTLLKAYTPEFYVSIDNFILTYKNKFRGNIQHSVESEVLIEGPIHAEVLESKI